MSDDRYCRCDKHGSQHSPEVHPEKAMSDLGVWKPHHEDGEQLKPATEADIELWLLKNGATREWWCSEDGNADEGYCRGTDHNKNNCGWVIVWRRGSE